jgi:hypothetical protein
MNKFETISRLRLHAKLAEYGLDQPLDEHDLALQLLNTELRLAKAEEDLGVIEEAIASHGIQMDWPDTEYVQRF